MILLNKIFYKAWYWLSAVNPKWRVQALYYFYFGRLINWNHPTEMNEKIRWLQFNTDTSKWTLLADKYRVREYLESKGWGNLLVKLYGKWDNADDIEFEMLPNSFVIKTNHGCGSVYIVKDKNTTNLDELRNALREDLSKSFGNANIEFHYKKIKPVIIAEQLLEQDSSEESSLKDYKFYTVNGQPIVCGVMFNRSISTHLYNVQLYDMNWQRHDEWLAPGCDPGERMVDRPKSLQTMIEACHDLGKEFPFVRIDFYDVKGKCYFGELTFTPAALTGGSLSKNYCMYIGGKINLKTAR